MEDTAAGDPGDDVHNQPVPGVGEDLQTAAHPSAAPAGAAGPAAGAGLAASAGPAGAAGLTAGAGPAAEAEAQPGSANPWPHLDSYMEYKSADFVKRTVLFKCRLCMPKNVTISAHVSSLTNLKSHVKRQHLK